MLSYYYLNRSAVMVFMSHNLNIWAQHFNAMTHMKSKRKRGAAADGTPSAPISFQNRDVQDGTDGLDSVINRGTDGCLIYTAYQEKRDVK